MNTEIDPEEASSEPVGHSGPVIEHDVLAPEPLAPPPPLPAPAPRRNGAGSAVLLSFILSIALGGAGYYAWTHPNPEVEARLEAATSQAQTAADQVSALSRQVAALNDRVGKLESAPAPAAPAQPDLGDLPKRVDDLAARLEALANRPLPATNGAAPAPVDNGAAQQAVADLRQRTTQALDAQKSSIDQLGGKVDQLGSQLAQVDTRVAALEKGFGQSKGTAAAGVRLTRIEAALVALQAGQPLGNIPGAGPALARFATTAPPTDAKLRESFPALADHAQAVSEPDLQGRSFWERALTRLQSAVTVRQGKDVLVGDPAAGILSDARVKVANGDIAGAVDVLRQLSGPAAGVMQGWTEQAASLLAARAALAELAAHS